MSFIKQKREMQMKKVWLSGIVVFLLLILISLPIYPQDKVTDDVSEYLIVTEIKERSHLRKRSKPRIIYDVNSEITIKNISDKTITAPIRAVVNVVGAGCSNKIFTRAFSRIYEHDLTKSHGIERLSPGGSATFSLKFEKQANIQISYEVLTYGAIETENPIKAEAKE